MKKPTQVFPAVALSTSALTTLAMLVAAGPAGAATPANSPYAGSASGTIVQVSAALAGQSLAQVGVGSSSADADSSRSSGQATADARNIAAAVGGVNIPLDDTSATAAPTASADGSVPALDVAPLLDLGIIGQSAQADYSTHTSCPSPLTDALGTGTTKLASASVVTLPGTLPAPLGGANLVSLGVSSTTSSTKVSGSSLVSTSTSTIGDISLLGGDVTVHVASPVVLTATSNGSTGSYSYNNPTVTVTVAGQTPIDLTNLNGGSIALPGPLSALASLSITLLKPTDQSSGATGKAELPALLDIDLSVAPAGVALATAHLAISPMTVQATAPAGGVTCYWPGGSANDTDGDGLPNWYETQVTHTDPDNPDSNGNGIPDGQEDPDHDGLTNKQELAYGTNPLKKDTDGDGLTDKQEIDGVKETYTVRTPGTKPHRVTILAKTNPLKKDTDGDGLSDKAEEQGSRIAFKERTTGHRKLTRVTMLVKTNPLQKDTDRDGLTDGQEVKGTENGAFGHQPSNPLNWDTDGGGVSDGREEHARSNPNDWMSSPAHPHR